MSATDSATEKEHCVNRKELYSSPEIVCLGEAIELTGGGPEVVAEGSGSPPNTFKDV